MPGNHEFYGTCIPLLREELALEAERLDIELLDNRAVTLNGVRFYGTTLWTDFALYAGDPTQNPADTESKALRYMPDFKIVQTSPGVTFTPQASQQVHAEALAWLEGELSQPFDGPKVVVSHHAPLHDCIPDQYLGDALSPRLPPICLILWERWMYGCMGMSTSPWIFCLTERVLLLTPVDTLMSLRQSCLSQTGWLKFKDI